MRIKIHNEYEITFSVCFYEEIKSGMYHKRWNDKPLTIEDAIKTLEFLKIHRPDNDWIIRADVEVESENYP